jgi:hypothetical protein
MPDDFDAVTTLSTRECELAAFGLRVANVEDTPYEEAEDEMDVLADRLERVTNERSMREQRLALAHLLATLPSDEDRGRVLEELKTSGGPLEAAARTLETAGEEIQRA